MDAPLMGSMGEFDGTVTPADDASVRRVASRAGEEPLPAPLPSMRQDYRPGIWVEPEAASVAEEPAEPAWVMPPLPSSTPKRTHGVLISFALAVLLPTALVAGYYYLLAEDEYFAEFRFSVSQGNPVLPGSIPATVTSGATGQGAGASGALASISSMLGGSSGPSSTQNFIVTDYLKSPQAVRDLQKRIAITELYAKPEISWLERFDKSRPIEKFIGYFQQFVYSDYDQVTGLAVANVRAYRPQDAKLIAKTMADLSEELVNDINNRANKDAVRYAEEENKRAEQYLKDVNVRLLNFRTREGVINPETGVVTTNVALVQALQGQVVDLQTQLGTLGLQNIDGNSPSVRLLRSQIASSKEQLADVEHKIAHDSEGARALAPVVGEFEDLTFQQQYAEAMLTQTMQALELARANAIVQHLYIEPYVMPSTPEMSTYPRRALNTVIGAVSFFGFWLLGLLIFRSIQDHAV